MRKARWDGVCPAEGPTASGLLVTQLCILGKWRAQTVKYPLGGAGRKATGGPC